jgi:glycosyltransferase involved in cell wall biosynthesis
MVSKGLLKDIPPSPPDKTNWPWTAETPPLPSKMPDGKPWPKISIVTPSYNQGQFLEETIRSVLLQNYPNLEYLIMDGDSKDNSVEIIMKYQPWLTHWASEKDGGQADAIYRGFEKATGDILGWVNSDDLMLPNSLKRVAEYFNLCQEKDCVVGGSVFIDINSRLMADHKGWPICNLGMPVSYHRLLNFGCGFCQPATFWRRHAFFSVGGFDRSLRFCFDYDMYLRLSKIKSFGWIREWLAAFRIHPNSKSSTLADTMHAENELLWRKYGRSDTRLQSIWVYRKTDRLIYLLMHLGIKLKLLKLPSLADDPSNAGKKNA